MGGGIGTVEKAAAVLGAGARRVIVGSALFGGASLVNHRVCADAGRRGGVERLVFSVDTKQGRVAVKGWKDQVELTPEEAIPSSSPIVGLFSIRISIGKGRCRVFLLRWPSGLRQKTQRQLIVAGGIREQAEIDALDAIGVDAVAGMAVYSGKINI